MPLCDSLGNLIELSPFSQPLSLSPCNQGMQSSHPYMIGGPLREGLTCGCAMWKVVHSLQVHELLTSPNLGLPASGLLVSLACDFSHCLGFRDSFQASLIACSLEEKL